MLNPLTGEVLSSTTLATSQGVLVLDGTNGLCWDATAGVLRIVVRVGSRGNMASSQRYLGVVDPSTGVVTVAGILSRRIAAIACAPDGTLYALAGQRSASPHTLFTVNTGTADLTMVAALAAVPANNTDGEALSAHPSGLLYRASGAGTPKYFGSVTTAGVEADVGLNPEPAQEFVALTPRADGTMYAVDLGRHFGVIDTAGVWQETAVLPFNIKGLAYVP